MIQARQRFIASVALVATCLVGNWLTAAEKWSVLPENANTITVLEGDETYLDIGIIGWGPKWQWLGFRGQVEAHGDGAKLTGSAEVRASGARVSYTATVRKAGPTRLEIDCRVGADRDTDLIGMMVAIDLPKRPFAQGKVIATASGEQRETELPLARKGVGKAVSAFTLFDATGRRTRFRLAPATDIPTDGQMRIIIAGSHLAASRPQRLSVTVDFPAAIELYANTDSLPVEPGADLWYPFQPKNDLNADSELDMSDWLDAPAGRKGRITRQGSQLMYGGRPIKLWGLNVCYSSCAPDKELADRRARFYARFGINTVRLHKFADGSGWAGIQSKNSFAEFAPEGLERMDYFIAQLKRRGIYVNLSSHFGTLRAGPADRRDIPFLDEFGAMDPKKKRVTLPASAFFYSPEIQNLQIRQMVNLLRHRNPHTGLTYAQDPAIAFIEIINEQSILFYTSPQPLKASATLRRQVGQRFCDWLREKYGSQEKLMAAWGRRAFDSFTDMGFPRVGESLDENNILPLGNPWYWDPEQLEGSQSYRKQRLLDTLEFLYRLQCEAYDRYVKAVREAGYQGEILGSNWQAGRAFSHYLNLHSDYRVGLIDRHNYFGGGKGGKINNASMLASPGSGMLSAGMQQVADRPFMLSEWIHVFPNEWGVEGPAVIGAYGMGLQGWDVSYMFQNRDTAAFASRLGDSWQVTAPQVLGVFPAVARQVLRSDVSESKVRAPRYVHLRSLFQGKLGFDERVTQQHDVKAFDGDKVPAAALAVARCVVEFDDRERTTPAFDVDRFRRGGTLVSSTGQLHWHAGADKHDGFITIDTPGTKAVVGFARGQTCKLGAVTITPASPFAAIYVVAKDRDADIASARSLLVVALARARNTGMRIFRGARLLSKGGPPIRLEPVKATITIDRPGAPAVHLLDHDGVKRARTLLLTGNTFDLDTGRDRTPYYAVRY